LTVTFVLSGDDWGGEVRIEEMAEVMARWEDNSSAEVGSKESCTRLEQAG